MRPLSCPVITGSAGALCGGGGDGKKVERQPMLRIVQLGRQRQPELEQRIEQPVLGELDLSPVRLVLGWDRSGIIRLCRQAAQNCSGLSTETSQLQAPSCALAQ